MIDQTVSKKASPRSPDALRQDLQGALEAVEQALELPASELKDEIALAIRTIASVRDDRISQLREVRREGGETADLQAILNLANLALTLSVGVEYPAGSLNRTRMEQAVQVLRQLIQEIPK